MRLIAAILFFLLITSVGASGENLDEIPVLNTEPQVLSEWKIREFNGITEYKPVVEDGRHAIHALSQGVAAAYYREIKVDINQYPYLTWSWKLVEASDNPHEKTKPGDDFPARIYVVVKTGFFPWQAVSLNYVWSMDTDREVTTWPSPYTELVVMKKVNQGRKAFGEWQHHKVNVQKDLEEAFGELYQYVDGIAIMTDMDGSGKSAQAYYGKIVFSRD